MNKFLIKLLMIFVTVSGAMSSTLFAQEAELVDEDAPRLTTEQRLQIQKLNEEFQAITDPIAKRDRRYPQYAADLEELKNISDDVLFAEKARSFTANMPNFSGMSCAPPALPNAITTCVYSESCLRCV